MQSLERCGQSAGVCPRTPKLDGMIRKNTWAHRGAVAWVYLLVDVRALAAAGADGGRFLLRRATRRAATDRGSIYRAKASGGGSKQAVLTGLCCLLSDPVLQPDGKQILRCRNHQFASQITVWGLSDHLHPGARYNWNCPTYINSVFNYFWFRMVFPSNEN